MSAVLISDLHLDSNTPERFERMDVLLRTEAARNQAIYILGDLVEVWVGDDDDAPDAQRLQTTLRAVSDKADLFVMHGNRDFLFGQDFADRVGATLIDDPTVVDIAGIRALLTHGDSFCTGDAAYQQLRTMFRSAEWQDDIRARSLDERRQLAAGLRAQSTAASANKAQNIMDVTLAEVDAALEAHDCGIIIHGHTHRPAVHETTSGGRRYVLGEWDACGWLCRISDATVNLECFPVPLANPTNGGKAS